MTKLGLLVFLVCAALGGLRVVVPVAGQDVAVRECVIVSRAAGAAPTVSDATECGHATAPASTFKVPHALIALQTGVITPATVFKWNGTAYDFESWRRDHTLDSAMKASVLPFFQNTARLIGAARMRKSLAEIRYAADTFDGDVTTFWIDGDLVVSPMEQFDFLQRLFSARLRDRCRARRRREVGDAHARRSDPARSRRAPVRPELAPVDDRARQDRQHDRQGRTRQLADWRPGA